MTQPINIDDYFQTHSSIPIIDVRTPAEFEKGHMPGAFNVPLFSNEERIQVGTTYKQQSREAAILLGFDLAGPKWSGFIKDCLQQAPAKTIAVHCWRGGMRSGAMAWALDMYGFKVFIIKGGYKHYRAWVRRQFEKHYHLRILGGMTGSGKTRLLQQMKTMGRQVIDLEELAAHRGSAYGSMNKLISPTQEQFENNLAKELYQMDAEHTIWMEDECRLIGRCSIPDALWHQMRNAQLLNWQVAHDQRVAFLVQEYGSLDKDFLIESTQRISKRLGPKETKEAIIAIKEDRMADFIKLVLVYYDKTNRKGLENRPPENIITIKTTGNSPMDDASEMIAHFPEKQLLQTNLH
jgi:tRNA 2-selenouridine synthase